MRSPSFSLPAVTLAAAGPLDQALAIELLEPSGTDAHEGLHSAFAALQKLPRGSPTSQVLAAVGALLAGHRKS